VSAEVFKNLLKILFLLLFGVFGTATSFLSSGSLSSKLANNHRTQAKNYRSYCAYYEFVFMKNFFFLKTLKGARCDDTSPGFSEKN
jgi:hypothetical protein